MTVVAVAGALASKAANGGEAWVRLSYALGFRRLGCGVRLIEEAHDATPSDLDYARSTAERFGLEYTGADTAAGGDLLVNISGNVALDERSAAGSGGRRSSTSTRASRSSGTSGGSSGSPRHDVYFTIGAEHRPAQLPDPDRRDRLASHPAAGRARRVAGRRRRRSTASPRSRRGARRSGRSSRTG